MADFPFLSDIAVGAMLGFTFALLARELLVRRFWKKVQETDKKRTTKKRLGIFACLRTPEAFYFILIWHPCLFSIRRSLLQRKIVVERAVNQIGDFSRGFGDFFQQPLANQRINAGGKIAVD